MTGHDLTANTDDDKTRIWFTCSCGYKGPARCIGDKPYSAMAYALAEAKRHFSAEGQPL